MFSDNFVYIGLTGSAVGELGKKLKKVYAATKYRERRGYVVV